MSHHSHEAERHLKRINICNDIWYGVFDCSSCAVLGLKIAPLCRRFYGMADKNLGSNRRRWTLGYIEFRCAKNGISAEVFKGGEEDSGVLLEKSALMDVPPPPNLVGFNAIEIKYLDQSVVTFLHRIRHLLNDTTLILPKHKLKDGEWGLIHTHIWPLIAQRLFRLLDRDGDVANIYKLRTFISPTVLLDCANLRVINSWELFPRLPADDRTRASDIQAMYVWLRTPRSDGLPKVYSGPIVFDFSKVETFKQAFIDDELPVSYILALDISEFPYDDIPTPFECVNQRTGERMTFHKTTESPDENVWTWLLKRGPICWGENEWMESERQAKASCGDLSGEMNLISCEEITFANDFV